MEKKKYIAPEMEVVDIDTVEMISASIEIGEGEADAGDSFSNRHRGEWGNLWK